MSGEREPDAPAPVRFRLGSLQCTVVSDGRIHMGQASEMFPTADPSELAALFAANGFSGTDVTLELNLLLVEVDGRLVLFDTGAGDDPAFGRRFYGGSTGRMVAALADAGIAPADIDVVALTHAHPDHAWGLVDEAGDPVFPAATLAVSRADFDYFTDLGHVPTAPSERVAHQFRGASKNLMPYAALGRIMWVADEMQLVPGVTAVLTPGHSPGHVVYLVESEGEGLVVWGDLCHHLALLQRPDWSFKFDFDMATATAERRRIYDLVERNGWRVAACHFPASGIGTLRRIGQSYSWVPSDLDAVAPARPAS